MCQQEFEAVRRADEEINHIPHMEITYLKSQRKQHLLNHFEIRLTEAFGRTWWLVFDDKRHRPEHVGKEEKLPGYARAQLAKLRLEPQVGERRQARYINATMGFFPGQVHNGIPHDQNVACLRQYHRFEVGIGVYDAEKGYLVVLEHPGNEDWPLEIWEHFRTRHQPDPNHLDALYTLVWKRKEDV